MAELDINQTTTTDFSGTEDKFTVGAVIPDAPDSFNKKIVWDYPDAAQNLGYSKSIPELKSALKALSIYVCGQGWKANARTTANLNSLKGSGEDSFPAICRNLLIQKKVFGDAFAEIIRNDDKSLLNIKPLYPGDMRSNWGADGMIESYEQRSKVKGGKPTIFQPNQILHLVNDRIANEIHGISVIESLKIIIDAKNEALADEITIRHREMLGILEVDTQDPIEIANAVRKIQEAYKKKEVLVTMKGVSEFKDVPFTVKDRIQWLQYLDNLFYQVVGVPKVIATSEGYSEAAAKVGIFTFDPVYTSDQREMESDLWNQVGIRVTFNPAPSLGGTLQDSEAKNTGQTQFQQNDIELSATRTE